MRLFHFVDRWSDTSNYWASYTKDNKIKMRIADSDYYYSLIDDGSFFMLFDDFLNKYDTVESCEYPLASGKCYLKTT